MQGLAISSHYPNSGIFADAAGINPYINPFSKGADVGLLQTSSAVTPSTGSVIVDNVYASYYLGTALTGYFYGDSGHLYSLNTASFPGTPTDLRTVANPAPGLSIWQVAGGTKYLYYFRLTNIGTFDLNVTFQDASYAGLQSTVIHPPHQFVGNLYYGNKDRIGGLLDGGSGTVTHTTNLLDFPSDFIVTTLNDDGYYLVIGATTNTINGNINFHTVNKIFFWDTVSSSWQKEWSIETAYIASIQKIGNLMYALCADGLYAFSSALPPTLLIPLSGSDSPATVGGVEPTHEIACVRDGVLYWISANNEVCAYGSPIPGLTPRFFKPYKVSSSYNKHISVATKFIFAVGGSNLGSLTSASGGATGYSAETIYVPLERKWNILGIDVILGEPMASGDSLNIDVKSDEDTSASDWGTMSYAIEGAVRTKRLSNRYTAENLKLVFNFNGGNVKIKKVIVYGEPMNI